MKPNIKFLRKVVDGEVWAMWDYSERRGGYSTYKGGEKVWNAHADAGYCTHPRCGRLWVKNCAQLTEKGREVLDAAPAPADAGPGEGETTP